MVWYTNNKCVLFAFKMVVIKKIQNKNENKEAGNLLKSLKNSRVFLYGIQQGQFINKTSKYFINKNLQQV